MHWTNIFRKYFPTGCLSYTTSMYIRVWALKSQRIFAFSWYIYILSLLLSLLFINCMCDFILFTIFNISLPSHTRQVIWALPFKAALLAFASIALSIRGYRSIVPGSVVPRMHTHTSYHSYTYKYICLFVHEYSYVNILQ